MGKFVDEAMAKETYKKFDEHFAKRFPRCLVIMTRDASARSPWHWTYYSISKKVNAGEVRRALVQIAKHMRGVGE